MFVFFCVFFFFFLDSKMLHPKFLLEKTLNKLISEKKLLRS